jgi:hypothetical protein
MAEIDWNQAEWRTSGRSNSQGDCVEVATTREAVGVRDSKDRHGAQLIFSVPGWQTFIDGVKRGEFDH